MATAEQPLCRMFETLAPHGKCHGLVGRARHREALTCPAAVLADPTAIGHKLLLVDEHGLFALEDLARADHRFDRDKVA